MKCAAMRKKPKQKMSREDKEVLNKLTSRYHKLRMTMSHKAAIEQLRKEAEDAEHNRENSIDDRAVHKIGSDIIEEREDRPAE